ncbi:MAG: hypothetical protein PVS3B2_11940 [Candidatus Dormibacteraceae bacterium]
MEDRVSRVSAILHEAAETHHIVYRIVDGTDADWASWYAEWLIKLSELPGVLGQPPVRSELIYALVKLDKEYLETKPDDAWETFYAKELIATFATGAAAGKLPGDV